MLTTRHRHALLVNASACRRALSERQQRPARRTGTDTLFDAATDVPARVRNLCRASCRRVLALVAPQPCSRRDNRSQRAHHAPGKSMRRERHGRHCNAISRMR